MRAYDNFVFPVEEQVESGQSAVSAYRIDLRSGT
jgi:hypothetical protein